MVTMRKWKERKKEKRKHKEGGAQGPLIELFHIVPCVASFIPNGDRPERIGKRERLLKPEAKGERAAPDNSSNNHVSIFIFFR
jgi:hypothetical protein